VETSGSCNAGFAANTLLANRLILSLRGLMQLWYDWMSFKTGA